MKKLFTLLFVISPMIAMDSDQPKQLLQQLLPDLQENLSHNQAPTVGNLQQGFEYPECFCDYAEQILGHQKQLIQQNESLIKIKKESLSLKKRQYSFTQLALTLQFDEYAFDPVIKDELTRIKNKIKNSVLRRAKKRKV